MLASAVLLGALGCKTGADGMTPPADQGEVTAPVGPPTQPEQDLQAANNRFGFSLLAKLLAGRQENVFISPSSVAMCLDMALAGAAGETQQAMAKALDLRGLSPAAVNQANLDLRKALASADPEVKLSIANSLWLARGIEFVPGFLDIGTKFYGAKVSSLDFGSPGAGQTINDWVKENTGGKIPTIVPDGPQPGIVCALVNAVYFVGRWTHVFDKANTRPHPFTFFDGSKKDLPMMTESGHFEYLENADLQAIRLPYGTERMAMYVFLPAQSSSIGEFCKTLTAEDWEQWLGAFRSSEGKITLPKFRAEYGVQLNDALKAMGMEVAFQPGRADFSGMCGKPGDVWIDQVLHKTYVEVDEEGTKAAAATSTRMAGAMAPGPVKPFEMVVDRPFFCAIVDRRTNAILFFGAIVSPESPGG